MQLKVWLVLGALTWTACTSAPGGAVASTASPATRPSLILHATSTPTPAAEYLTVVTATASPTPTVVETAPRPTPEALERLPGDVALSIYSLHMVDERRGWAVGWGPEVEVARVLRTTDGGGTWQDVSPPVAHLPSTEDDPSRLWPDTFFLDETAAWVAYRDVARGTGPGTIWRTSDGGLTWEPSWGRGRNSCCAADSGGKLHFLDRQYGWLQEEHFLGAGSTTTEFFRTEDGGKTWDMELYQGDPWNSGWIGCCIAGMDFADSLHGIAAGSHPVIGDAIVHWTTDGGRTWRSQDLPSAPAYCDLDPPMLFSPQQGLVVLDCPYEPSGTFLYRTRDGGASWDIVRIPLDRVRSVEVVDSLHILALSYRSRAPLVTELHRSRDGGKSWTKLATLDWSGDLDFVSEQVGWGFQRSEFWAPEPNVLVQTTDGGRTWRQVGPKTIEPLPPQPPRDLPPPPSIPGKVLALGQGNAGRIQQLASVPSDRPTALAWFRDGVSLAVAQADGRIVQWTIGGGPTILNSHADWVYDLAYSTENSQLASASKDGTAKVWSMFGSTEDWATLRPDRGEVTAAAFSPDGELLAIASQDGAVKLFDPSSLDEVATLRAQTDWVWDAAFSPDNATLATGSEDRTIVLWDVETREVRATLRGHTSAVARLAYAPDGTLLASASWDGTVKLWDPSGGEALRTLAGHTDWVLDVAFSPDGTLLASSSADGTVRLWDPVTGDLLTTLSGHGAPVRGLAFSPDGTLLATSGDDGTVRFWGVTA